MFGNERNPSGRRPSHEARTPADAASRRSGDRGIGFIEELGRFVQNPIREIERKNRLNILHAAATVILTSLAIAIANALRQEAAPPLILGRRLVSLVIAGLAAWIVMTFLWHLVSKLFRHPGDFRSFLCRTSVSSVTLWPIVMFGLVAQTFPAAAWVSAFASQIMALATIFLIWRGIKTNYAWSGIKAVLILLVPLVLGSSAIAILGVFFALSFVSGAFLAHLI